MAGQGWYGVGETGDGEPAPTGIHAWSGGAETGAPEVGAPAGGPSGTRVSQSRSCAALGRAAGSLAMPARSTTIKSAGTPGMSGIGSVNSSIRVSRLGSRSSRQRGGLPRITV
jgi:hypothetical protein